MKVHILHAGYCTAPEHIAIQGGRWRSIHFPAMFALLQHPRFGPMLFDSGYSYRFFEETKTFPNRSYRLMTPVRLREHQSTRSFPHSTSGYYSSLHLPFSRGPYRLAP